jgi:uncharacterized protein (DUF1501 family)
MKHFHSTRRDFLRLGAALAGSAAAAATAQTADYKALVCIYLFGGNDGHNLIVPMEAAAYASYRAARGPLALPDGTASLIPVSTPGGVPYGLNSGLTTIAPLWAQQRLAVVANVGTLVRPVSRAEVLAGTAPVPPNLYSHADQTLQQQAGLAGGSGTGWGGRVADGVQSRNGTARFPASISLSGQALFNAGSTVASASLIPDFDLAPSGLRGWPDSVTAARRAAAQQVLAYDNGMALVQAANKVRQDAFTLNTLLSASGSTTVSTVFPGYDVAYQLRQVAQIIKLRGSTGMSRQVFFVGMGGYDTHSGQNWMHWDLLRQLSESMAAFHAATVELGVASQVTTFTQSDFGRTLQPSGSGSDHGWGNHQLVMGGAVKGGNVYGRFPYPALGGVDDAGNRGALVPSTSLEQFGATLARWFGVPEAGLVQAFPNLGSFGSSNLGFMG